MSKKNTEISKELKLYTIEDLSYITKYKKTTIRQLLSRKPEKLPAAKKLGNRVVFRERDILNWITELPNRQRQ